MCENRTMQKINAYLAIHQRLGSKGNGDFNAIAAEVGHEKKLDYPLREAKGPVGETIEFYDIPPNDKESVLRELYPFRPIPSMDDIVFDIHEEKSFKVRDFMVMRDHGLNFLVSPYFSSSGGSVLDWVCREKDVDDESGETIIDTKTLGNA